MQNLVDGEVGIALAQMRAAVNAGPVREARSA
jgi:hypothetical protein